MFGKSRGLPVHWLAISIAILVAGLIVSEASVGGTEPPVKIGFVNIFKVRGKSKKQVQLLQEFGKKIEQQQKALQDRGAKNEKRLREELPLYEKGTKEREDLFVKIKIEDQSLKIENQMLRDRYNVGKARLFEDFLKDLYKKLDAFGEANGFSAIFLQRRVTKIESADDLLYANSQWVLYHNKALDLTDEVITIMNKK